MTQLNTEVSHHVPGFICGAPRVVSRKKPLCRSKSSCAVCGKTRVSPHHLVSREDGGLPISDNIVWLCEEHHNIVENPALYPDYDFLEHVKGEERVLRLKLAYSKPGRPQPKALLDSVTSKSATPSKDERFGGRLEELWRKNRSRGYLTTPEQQEYDGLLDEFANGRDFVAT